MKNVARYVRQAKILKKEDYSDQVIAYIDKIKKNFPFVQRVFDAAKGYILEVKFDGILDKNVIQSFMKNPKFKEFDIINNNTLQIIYSK